MEKSERDFYMENITGRINLYIAGSEESLRDRRVMKR